MFNNIAGNLHNNNNSINQTANCTTVTTQTTRTTTTASTTANPGTLEVSPTGVSNGMRSDAYQRTLEYVQNCQNWVDSTDMVSSSTHPSSNMIINDMSTSLNSYLEEDRYLQMIQ